MKKLFILIPLTGMLFSCGPNAQQQAQMQQKHDDSLKTATENDIMQKLKSQQDSTNAAKSNAEALAAKQKQHDDSIANSVAAGYQHSEAVKANGEMKAKMQQRYNQLLQALVADDGKLTALNDRKTKDAQFHLGRTQAQREQWLANDQRDIDNLKIQMMNIKKTMLELKSKL